MPEEQLVGEDRSQGPVTGVGLAFGGHGTVRIEETLELLVEVFNCNRAQFVEEAAHFLGVERVVWTRIAPVPRSHQGVAIALAIVSNGGRVVVGVAQNKADWGGQLLQQLWRDHVVCGVGGGELGGQRNPDVATTGRQMELPSIDPAVVPRLGPARLGVDWVSMPLCGTRPTSLSFLCHTRPQ